jgi:hypothetical protein
MAIKYIKTACDKNWQFLKLEYSQSPHHIWQQCIACNAKKNLTIGISGFMNTFSNISHKKTTPYMLYMGRHSNEFHNTEHFKNLLYSIPILFNIYRLGQFVPVLN